MFACHSDSNLPVNSLMFVFCEQLLCSLWSNCHVNTITGWHKNELKHDEDLLSAVLLFACQHTHIHHFHNHLDRSKRVISSLTPTCIVFALNMSKPSQSTLLNHQAYWFQFQQFCMETKRCMLHRQRITWLSCSKQNNTVRRGTRNH